MLPLLCGCHLSHVEVVGNSLEVCSTGHNPLKVGSALRFEDVRGLLLVCVEGAGSFGCCCLNVAWGSPQDHGPVD